MVVGLDDFRGHDPSHEQDWPWTKEGQIGSQLKTCNRSSGWSMVSIDTSKVHLTCTATYAPVLRFLMTKKNGWSAMTCGYSTRVLVRAIIPGRGTEEASTEGGAVLNEHYGTVCDTVFGNVEEKKMWCTWPDSSLRPLLSHFQISLLHRLPNIQVLTICHTHTDKHTHPKSKSDERKSRFCARTALGAEWAEDVLANTWGVQCPVQYCRLCVTNQYSFPPTSENKLIQTGL